MRVAVALSGGVDSTIAAWTLKKEGYDVLGLTMRVCPDDIARTETIRTRRMRIAESVGHCTLCTDPCSCLDAVESADILDIPHEIVDLREPFEREVIKPFCREYLDGRTPNPCAYCNPAIKFGRLAQIARERGADRLATGHYARTRFGKNGRLHLLKAVDRAKDQSYFLSRLSQDHLAFSLFPIGDISKEEVREIARQVAPALPERRESQEICFLHYTNPGDYIKARYYDRVAEGEITDEEGIVVGTHKGLPYYTIGQRRGLGTAMGEPRYVVSLDLQNNRVVIGPESSLYRDFMQVESLVWTSGAPIEAERRFMVKIRYATPAAMATVRPEGERLLVRFDEPVRAITPGQISAFYEGDEVVGGGIITRS